MKFLIRTIKLSFFITLLPFWLGILFISWFVPWVFVFHTGLLFYFPYQPDGETRYLRVTGPVTRLWSDEWVKSKEIPSTCKNALVASEDSQFYHHYGIDLKSIQENIKLNHRAKKIKRGGSTITQQLVKNAFLGRERTYLRKAREISGALLLNLILSKDEQQTWYLNVIEFGPGIYGLEQAARNYFKTSAATLSPSQCVALMAIIPSPKKWNRSLSKRQLSPFFIRRYYQILTRMRQMGLESPKNMTAARGLKFWVMTSSKKSYKG